MEKGSRERRKWLKKDKRKEGQRKEENYFFIRRLKLAEGKENEEKEVVY